jgi:AraC-like DNA-binding protein
MDTQNLLKNLHLYLLNVDECRAQNWNFQKVTSPFTRLYLIKNGEGTIVHNHKKHPLKPDYLYLIPSFTWCNYSSETFLEHCYIHFIPQITGGTDLFKLLRFTCELAATESDFRLIRRLLEINPGRKLTNQNPDRYSKDDLMPHELQVDSPQQIAVGMETKGILLQLFSRFIISEDQTGSRLNLNSKISQAIGYIQTNLSKPISIAELACACNLSNDYFSRLFLKITGMRPIDYINCKRIEDAQMQLVTTNDPIEKIALEVGIDNFSYFNRMFKKYSCIAPGEYRKLHRLV